MGLKYIECKKCETPTYRNDDLQVCEECESSRSPGCSISRTVDGGYAIAVGSNAVYYQRGHPIAATDTPLYEHEKIIRDLCEHILRN